VDVCSEIGKGHVWRLRVAVCGWSGGVAALEFNRKRINLEERAKAERRNKSPGRTGQCFDWVWKVDPRSRRVNVALPCISVQHDVVMPIFPLNKRVQAKSIIGYLDVAERVRGRARRTIPK